MTDDEKLIERLLDRLTEAYNSIITLKEVKPMSLNDDRVAIYEFLLKCKPKYEEDGEYMPDGTMNDCSMYHMSCKAQDMETLAYDLGVTIRDDGENEWQAIQRFMQNEIDAEEAETKASAAEMERQSRAISKPVK